jgi:hypothetical protein
MTALEPRLRHGEQCRGCLHPWWAHPDGQATLHLASPGTRYCIGRDCRCTRPGPASRLSR